MELEHAAVQDMRSGSHLVLGFDLAYTPPKQRLQAEDPTPTSVVYTMFRRVRTYNANTRR
jgi:hypothetical protein